MLLALLACADSASSLSPIAFCESDTHFLFDPTPDGTLAVFPDDHFTAPADTPTGLQVALTTADTPFLSEYPDNFVGIFDDLSTLDGWGLTSGIWFSADAVLPEIPAEQIRIHADGQDWPFDARTTDEGKTLLLLPRLPLPEATEVSVVVLNSDNCISPAPHTRDLLDPSVADPPALAGRYQAALEDVGEPVEDVAAMTVFTTQSASHVSRAVASDIAARDYTLTPGSCTQLTGFRQCDGTLTVQDYRDTDHVVPADSEGSSFATYDLPVRTWLPDAGSAPFPTVMCGHGLGGDRGQCDTLAELASPYGLAVIAVDAVEHGDHPGRTEAPFSAIQDLMIFAISVDPPGLDALRLRDNFRQSAWDKLQVVRAIEAGADVDGDGATDLDADHLAYLGVSLGAIMGPEPMALTDRFTGGVLVVGGGRVSSIIQDSPTFSVLVDLMRPADLEDGDVDRFFPVLQTVIDAGDPMVYAPHVALERYADAAEPDLLAMFAYQDQIVPNSSNEALARSLLIPGVGTEVWPVAGLEFVAAPLSGNLPAGGTGGTLQFGTVQEEPGSDWTAADHSSLHESVQGSAAILSFLEALRNDAVPTIDEPERE